MKTLVIHPNDPTTTFLKELYADLRNKTVVTGGATTAELLELFCSHDPTGMFISEELEADAHGFRLWTQQTRVHESNALFSRIVRRHINSDTRELYREVSREYGMVRAD